MAVNTELTGPPATATTIKVYALLGQFAVRNSPVRIRYATTFANPCKADGHRTLLEHLHPMRERTRPAELRNLQSLLQRDLNDARVAQELIPYLEGRSQVGFFPAILAVLLPKGYLHENESARPEYPVPCESGNRTKYGEFWEFERYRVGGQSAPLALLEINADRSDVIVLDGQHRAVAFRYVTNSYRPDDIYRAFYQPAATEEPLDADLPITLVWFESDEKLSPDLISRRLFVDVNNNARPVSEARTILLDDRSVPALGVQEFYNWSAARAFSPESFSLLHGSFDIDADLAASKLPIFALTAPPIIYDAIRWGLFSSTTWDSTERWRVERQRSLQTPFRFEQVFSQYSGAVQFPSEELWRSAVFSDVSTSDDFRSAFHDRFLPVLKHLFDHWDLLQLHYAACARVDDWVKREGATIQDVWEKVFRGGEGLYLSILSATESDEIRNYKNVIRQIESKFQEYREDQCDLDEGRGDALYRSVRTKAFQTGFVMAVDYLAAQETDAERIAGAEALVREMNKFSTTNWAHIFSDLRDLIIGGTGADPKHWPAYRNILLRVYDQEEHRLLPDESWSGSIEGFALEQYLKQRANTILEAEEGMPEKGRLLKYAKASIDSVGTLFAKCGFGGEWFEKEWVRDKVLDYLQKRIDSELGEEQR